jgi:hypothetical protein
VCVRACACERERERERESILTVPNGCDHRIIQSHSHLNIVVALTSVDSVENCERFEFKYKFILTNALLLFSMFLCYNTFFQRVSIHIGIVLRDTFEG